MKFQTDFDNALDIKKSGCYVCAIASEIERHISREIPDYAFEAIIEDANKKGFLTYDYKDDSKPGCFIMDDEGFGNLIFGLYGIRQCIVSIGRIYTAAGKSHYSKKKQPVTDTAEHADILMPGVFAIAQIQTPNGGHFRNFWHDPYRPGTDCKFIKSLRFYKFQPTK